MMQQPLEVNKEVLGVLLRSYKQFVDDAEIMGNLDDLLKWLAVPPLFTTLRLNTTLSDASTAMNIIETELKMICDTRGINAFKIMLHPFLPDCIVIENRGPYIPHVKALKEVIVDLSCGMAVLRGADVFKQGIMGAPITLIAGDRVSVVADLDGHCLRGFSKDYLGRKIYVGTGISMVGRDELFCGDSSALSGVGIHMTEALYQAPPLSNILPAFVFPQNLPSIVCGHVLDPKPGETILDMCASPGGKTTHIAGLMGDKGRVVALDKTADKVAKIKIAVSNFQLGCVDVYAFDARKTVQMEADASAGPPYPPNTFDRVLLDGPCSALGQRPSAKNKITASSLASFPKLQRMLLTAAVSLVRPGGVLVYSTCTVVMEENEDQVAWVLQTFPDMVLEKQTPHLGLHGFTHSSLSEADCLLVQRFDPSNLSHIPMPTCDNDTIGFFIAKFRKKEI